MTPHSTALLLLAAAIPLWSAARVPSLRLAWISGNPRRSTRFWTRFTNARLGTRPARILLASSLGSLTAVTAGWPQGAFLGAAVAAAAWWIAGRAMNRSTSRADDLGLAATWDLLSACLRAGLPVPTAVTAVVDDLPPEAAAALRASADLLALGADPVAAWAPAMKCPQTAGLARGARRTARSGTALADIATELATAVRNRATDAAETRAQRAGVLITAPLGLCFLPAFVCLGIAPVVAGLAGQLQL